MQADEKYTLRLLSPSERVRLAVEYNHEAAGQLKGEKLDENEALLDPSRVREILRILDETEVPTLTTQLSLEQLDFLYGLDSDLRRPHRRLKLMSSYLSHGQLAELEEIFASASIDYLSDSRTGPMVRLQITAATPELAERHRELHTEWVRQNHNVMVKGLDEVSWLLAEHTNRNSAPQSYTGMITPSRANWQADTTNWREQLNNDAQRYPEFAPIRQWIIQQVMDKEARQPQKLLLDTPSAVLRVTGVKDNGMLQLSSNLDSELSYDSELPYSFVRPERNDGTYRLYLSAVSSL